MGPYARIAHMLRENPTAKGKDDMVAPESFGPAKIAWWWRHDWFFYSSACVAEEGHEAEAEGAFDRCWVSCASCLSRRAPWCFKGLEKKSAIATAFFVIVLFLCIATGYGTFSSFKNTSHT